MTIVATPSSAPYAARRIARPPLLKIFAIQCVVLVLATITVFFPFDWVEAYSAFVGGLISIVPNAYFARQAFRYSGALYAREVNQAFYRGEVGKYATTVILFAVVFAALSPLNVLFLFLAYLAALLLNILLVAYFGWVDKQRIRGLA